MYQITNNNFIISLDGSLAYQPSIWMVQDRHEDRARIKRISHHVEADDYFGTLATIVDLARQLIEKKEVPLICQKDEHRERLKKIRDDLLFLQKNYKITKK